MKVRWLSRQYSRFDLALIKMSRPLVAINTLSNLSVALVIGFFLFGVLGLVGFFVILGLGYVLHKTGFFMETVTETFDQQQKILYHKQVKLNAAVIATCLQMSEEELKQFLKEAMEGLRLVA